MAFWAKVFRTGSTFLVASSLSLPSMQVKLPDSKHRTNEEFLTSSYGLLQPAAAPRGPPLTGQSKRWTLVGEPNLSNLFQDHREMDGRRNGRGSVICLSHYSPPGVSTGFAAEQGAGSSSFIPKQLAPNLSFKERESRLVTAGAPAVDAQKKMMQTIWVDTIKQSTWWPTAIFTCVDDHRCIEKKHAPNLRYKRLRRHLWPNEEPPVSQGACWLFNPCPGA